MKARLSPKTIAARARSAKLMLPPGADNGVSRYYTGGAKVNPRTEGMATGPSTDLMTREVYVPGMGETGVRRVVPGKVADCVCGCGHRPGCTGFLAIPSVGEAD
jgi:hypothetical protein